MGKVIVRARFSGTPSQVSPLITPPLNFCADALGDALVPAAPRSEPSVCRPSARAATMPKARLGGGLAPDQLSGGAGGSAEREAGIKATRPWHTGARSARPPPVPVPAAAALMRRGDGGMSLDSAPSDHLYLHRPRVTPAPWRRPSRR